MNLDTIGSSDNNPHDLSNCEFDGDGTLNNNEDKKIDKLSKNKDLNKLDSNKNYEDFLLEYFKWFW